MPAKPKNLPLPCPICDNPHGTIQLLFTGKDDVIIRIGHYRSLESPKSLESDELPLGYTKKKGDFKPKTKTKIDRSEEQQRLRRRFQRRWCSFRSNNSFFRALREYRIKTATIDTYLGHRDPPSTIRLTESGKMDLKRSIYLYGWQRRSEDNSHTPT